jgi:hypothetical protein
MNMHEVQSAQRGAFLRDGMGQGEAAKRCPAKFAVDVKQAGSRERGIWPDSPGLGRIQPDPISISELETGCACLPFEERECDAFA